MNKIKKIIFDFLCDIGRDPLPFIAGAVSVIIGFILGVIFTTHLK